MIRHLKAEEVALCCEGGRMFFDEGKIPGGFKPEVFIRQFKGFIERKAGTIIAAFGANGEIHGALGALIYNDIYNGDLVAMEAFWYMIPGHRGGGLRLFNAFEGWAMMRGAKRVAMVHLLQLQPETLKTLYERRGYYPIETNYCKVIQP